MEDSLCFRAMKTEHGFSLSLGQLTEIGEGEEASSR